MSEASPERAEELRIISQLSQLENTAEQVQVPFEAYAAVELGVRPLTDKVVADSGFLGV
jgi:hypothetical protein